MKASASCSGNATISRISPSRIGPQNGCYRRTEVAPQRRAHPQTRFSLPALRHFTGGKSTSVSLMRLNVLVKIVSAIASDISASCASV